jgi:hypothetical protein
MKRIYIGLLLLMGAALLGAQTAPEAVIQEITGTVEVKGPGSAEWKAAAAGQALDRASFVSTGFRSTVLIRIGNSSIMVRPLTRMSVEELAADQKGERVILNLRAGRIRANVAPPVGGTVSFSVRSPMATASVRGTVFEFDGGRLRVEEGRVHLGGAAVTGAYIGAGHSTAVDTETGKTATAVERMKEELSPPPPVGTDAVTAAPAASDPAAAPSSGGLGIGFDW